MTPFRILYVCLYHPELVRGGAQRVAYDLFHAAQGALDRNVYLLSSIEQHLYPQLFRAGARITGFDGRDREFLFLSEAYDHRWHKNLAPDALREFARLLRELKPDVVHFHHFLTFGIDFIPLVKRVLPQARVGITFHEFLAMCLADGQMVRRPSRNLCERASAVRCHQCFPDESPEFFFLRDAWVKENLAAADWYITPTKFMRDRYIAWGLDASKFHHIENPYNRAGHKADAPAAEARSRTRFAFFGQLLDNKGLDILLDAARILAETAPEASFDIEVNGDNLRFATAAFRERVARILAAPVFQIEGVPAELESQIKEQAARQDVKAASRTRVSVRFNGEYEPALLPRLMRRIDWVVIPSTWWEIYCLVLSEAWGHQRPVIASRVGGLGERITDGKDGLLFEPGDARDLAQVMARAIATPALARTLVEAAVLPPSPQEAFQRHVDLVYR